MPNATPQRAVSGAAGARLSNEQKAAIAQLARRAWERAGRPGYADQAPDTPPALRLSQTAALTIWRQNQQRQACGQLHLTAAGQGDYARIIAHLSQLAGDSVAATRWAERAATEPHRQAIAALTTTGQKVENVIPAPLDYARSIARDRFRSTDIESLSPKQIWTLVFDLRRAAAKRRADALPF